MSSPLVLVVGGAGFVGSHVCKTLASLGIRHVVYDNLSMGTPQAVRWGPLEVGALEDESRLLEVMERYRPTAVMHFAALTEAGRSVHQPELFYRNNVSGTLALLRAMQTCGIRQIVFSSTAAVYGEPQTVPIPESHPLRPLTPYGRSKMMAEEVLEDVARAQGLRYAALRYFNAAGADPDGELCEVHSPETHLVPLALEAALDPGRCLEVYGDDYDTADGTCVRDFVHVADLARAHVAALRWLSGGANNLVVNLGSGRGASILQVIETVEQVTGRRVRRRTSARRTGDPAVLVADVRRAREVLDWRPVHDRLAELVAHAAAVMDLRRRWLNAPESAEAPRRIEIAEQAAPLAAPASGSAAEPG